MAFATRPQLSTPQSLALFPEMDPNQRAHLPEMNPNRRARRARRITLHLSPRTDRERHAARVESYRKIRVLRDARKLLEKARRLIRSRSKAQGELDNKQTEPEPLIVNDLHTITRSMEGLDLEGNRNIEQVPEAPAATITAPVDDRSIILKITRSIEGLDLEDNSQEVPGAPAATITAPADDRKIILTVDFGGGRLSSEIRSAGQQHVFPAEDRKVTVENNQAEDITVSTAPCFRTTLPLRIRSEHNGSGNI